MAKIASPSELNRTYGIFAYFFNIITMVLAFFTACVVYGHWFHVPIFSCFVIANIVGIVAAKKYAIDLEHRVIHVCIIFNILCLLAGNYLFTKLDLPLVMYMQILTVAKLWWLHYRMRHLKWLQLEASHVHDHEIRELRGGQDS